VNIRKVVIGGVLVVIGLPVALVLIAATSMYVLDRSNGTLVSSGRERQYLLYVPPSYDHTKPSPLVISMHGAALWPAQQMNLSRWNRLADEYGFIVVYPSGTDVPKSWGGNADVRFISELIDALEAAYNIANKALQPTSRSRRKAKSRKRPHAARG
jgi:polyhydroxybutyrate depolymerase